jgi:hypothetical protein
VEKYGDFMDKHILRAPRNRNQPSPLKTTWVGSEAPPKNNEALYAEFAHHERDCRSAQSLADLAKQVLLTAGDTTYAGVLLSKALGVSNDVEAHLKVAETICRDLRDLNWGRCVYRRIHGACTRDDNLELTAESILETLNDRGWATQIFSDLERGAETPAQLVKLARRIRSTLSCASDRASSPCSPLK